MEKDPVCGMIVSRDTQYKTVYNGKIYYFCSMDCKRAFENDPEKYTMHEIPEHHHHGC